MLAKKVIGLNSMAPVKIEPEWKNILSDYFKTEKFQQLSSFIRQEYLTKKIYPQPENLFKAFYLTPFSKVKVVILGQDPYHNPGQAQGLCFSVPKGTTPPPSLKNIYKEIETDCKIKKDFQLGDLSYLAKQGVFLLNAILSVEAHKPTSHQKIGWEEFTDHIIKTLSDKKEHLVFILWGNYARSKKSLINSQKHLILEAPHPSPFSAYSGFFGCRHFSKCNQYLKEWSEKEIVW
jgi:uracil-DNA glycosylase